MQRLNISLDSLRPATFAAFAAITRGGDLAQVWAGIDAVEALGLPVKLNMVVMRGINDDELLAFAALTRQRKIAVRFIEQMPTVLGAPDAAGIVSGSEILSRLAQAFDLEALTPGERCGPVRWQGEDVKSGEVIMPAGTVLRPAEISMLASFGQVFASVHRQPRVAILSTGDELVELGEVCGEGQIVDSNSLSLAAAVREAGGEAILLGIARDERKAARLQGRCPAAVPFYVAVSVTTRP